MVMRVTCTGLVWPMRCARSMACSSTVGLYQRSEQRGGNNKEGWVGSCCQSMACSSTVGLYQRSEQRGGNNKEGWVGSCCQSMACSSTVGCTTGLQLMVEWTSSADKVRAESVEVNSWLAGPARM